MNDRAVSIVVSINADTMVILNEIKDMSSGGSTKVKVFFKVMEIIKDSI